MSQTFYERQSKLLKLYQELFARKEMNDNEALIVLKMIGFSETLAAVYYGPKDPTARKTMIQ